jgi:hypothetical protein
MLHELKQVVGATAEKIAKGPEQAKETVGEALDHVEHAARRRVRTAVAAVTSALKRVGNAMGRAVRPVKKTKTKAQKPGRRKAALLGKSRGKRAKKAASPKSGLPRRSR